MWTGLFFMAAPLLAGDVVVRLREAASYEVEGVFNAPVPVSSAWSVLSDYDGIASFVPSVEFSGGVQESPGHFSVKQILVGRALFFSRRVGVSMKVQEEKERRILFRDVSGEDFTVYEGEWSLEPSPDGTRVVYRLRAEPKFYVPYVVVRGALRRTAEDLLRDVRAEMLRRHLVQGHR